MEQKRVLIPNGNFSEWALINAAHRHGMYVIASGLNEDAPGNKFADEYVKADYTDKEAMLKLAKEKKIDYMVSNAHDAGMLSTAYVCEQLGLPGHDSLETTLTVHSKDRLKPLAKRLGLHMPVSEVFTDRDEAVRYILGCEEKVIVKPTDNVASIGVTQPNTPEEKIAAIDLAFSKSKSKSVLVEPFIEGYYTVVSSMIINQKVEAFFAHSGFVYPQGEKIAAPFPLYNRHNGGMYPAPYMDEWAPYIIEDINKLARELKLVDGKLHAELMITPKHEAWIFDLHRRMSGFTEPMPEWNYSTGLMWENWIVKAECGMDLSDFPKGIQQHLYFHSRSVYAPRDGKLKRMVFDNYLSSRMVPVATSGTFEMGDLHRFHVNPLRTQKNFTIENVEITDHRHQRLTYVRFRFDTVKEAEYISDIENDHFYEHVTFEYEDE